jgi:hypothetical protein
MKYSFLSFLFLFCFAISTAQVKYEEAYYIKNSGERVDGFIKNEGWKNNPSQIEFKENKEGEAKVLKLSEITEFGADRDFKYIRATVAMDRSSDDSNNLSSNKAPKLEEETLFLKVLIEGDANLYLYADINLQRFFYSKYKVPIEQLVYKRYKADNTIFGKNEQYKQQLYNNLKCQTLNVGMVNKLEYAQSDLAGYFKKYNKCRNAIIADYELDEPKGDFNLTVRPSLRIASFSFKNAAAKRKNATFDAEIGVGVGVELEYVIPYDRNKWALILEPTYQSYSPSTSITQGGQVVEVSYSSIEIPFGLRYYMFLDEKSKLFVNASFLVDLVLDSKLTFEMGDDLDVVSGSSIVLGFGYKYNNKYSAEVRYQTDRSLTVDYNAYNSKYSSFCLLFGYTLF